MNNQTVNNRIWLFVVGDNKVGKTDAIFHFLKTNPQNINSYSMMTYNKIISLLDRKVLISILAPNYNNDSIQFLMRLSNSTIMYFYDVTNSESFTTPKQIYSKYHKNDNNDSMRIEILVGNTNNLECQREISYDEAYTFAKSHNMNYFEINVVTGENVFECFYSSITQATGNNNESKKSIITPNVKVQSKKSSFYCVVN